MPTVKWVDGWYDNRDDVPVEVQGALTTVPWPVLTLNDLEAWLKQYYADKVASLHPDHAMDYKAGYAGALYDLLAQVREWKAQP